MVRAITIIAGFLVLALWAAGPAVAQAPSVGKKPVLLTADELSFDREAGIVTAKGNVEISQEDRVLKADNVIYNQKTGVVKAKGNISLAEPSGEVIFTDSVELSDDLREGVIDNIRMLFPDESRFAANGAVRTGGNKTDMRKAVFSPCRLCPDDPTKPPLWQIRADRIVHDQTKKNVEYEDARMEILGVPISYAPFFWHADPTVKRRSGLLVPEFRVDDNLGFTARTPYFWAISEDWDATIKPLWATKELPVAAAEVRHRFQNGELEVDGSITSASKIDNQGNDLGNDLIRGHIFGKARYDIDNNWRMALDGALTTDDTYLRRYSIDRKQNLTGPEARASVLTSRAQLEGFHGRNYSSFDASHFQSLREEVRQADTAFPVPEVNYNFVSDPMFGNGSRFTFDGNFLNLFRLEGTDSRRLSGAGGWEMPYIDPLGGVLRLSASLQADLYWVNSVNRGGTDTTFNGVVTRFFPQAVADWRLPVVRELGNVRHLIEPRVAVTVAPNGVNDRRIPNEDSRDVEFDDTNLFSANRFPGLDRVDDSQRLTYGLRTAFYGNDGGQTELFLGQSFRFHTDNFSPGLGFRDDFSDIVGRVLLQPADYLDMTYRFRLDPDQPSLRRNEVGFSAGPEAVRVSANYLFLDESTTLAEFDEREEISGGIVANVTENWSASARTTYDLAPNGGPLQYGGAVTYHDECLLVSVDLSRNFTNDRDLQASTEVFVRVVFKHLGELGAGN